MNRKRPHQVKFYLSDNELQLLQAKLADYQGTLSDFMRALIQHSNPEQIRGANDGLKELTRQIKAIGNNLNQLTKLAHQGLFECDKGQLSAIRKELQSLSLLSRQLVDAADHSDTPLTMSAKQQN